MSRYTNHFFCVPQFFFENKTGLLSLAYIWK